MRFVHTEKGKTMTELKLSMNDISIINRALGVIEGLTYAVQDQGVADGLISAIERIEAVVNGGADNG